MFGNEIIIGGVKYSVEENKHSAVNNDSLGRYFQKECLISVDKNLNEDQKEKTKVHEVLHGIIFEYAVDINEDQHEKIVAQLTTGFHEVLKQVYMNGKNA